LTALRDTRGNDDFTPLGKGRCAEGIEAQNGVSDGMKFSHVRNFIPMLTSSAPVTSDRDEAVAELLAYQYTRACIAQEWISKSFRRNLAI